MGFLFNRQSCPRPPKCQIGSRPVRMTRFVSYNSFVLLCCNQRDDLQISEFERSCNGPLRYTQNCTFLSLGLVINGFATFTEFSDYLTAFVYEAKSIVMLIFLLFRVKIIREAKIFQLIWGDPAPALVEESHSDWWIHSSATTLYFNKKTTTFEQWIRLAMRQEKRLSRW